MKHSFLIALVLVVLFPVSTPLSARQDGFVIIVHPDVPTLEASKKRVSQIMLKEVSRWDDDLSTRPVDLDSKSPTRDKFSKFVHGRSVTSIKNYWLRKIFSGSAEPPPEMPSDAAAIDFVRTHPGAIGYVSAGARVEGSGVKVLNIASN